MYFLTMQLDGIYLTELSLTSILIKRDIILMSSCYYCSVLSCVQLYDPMDCSMPVFPVLHYLPEFPQTQNLLKLRICSNSMASIESMMPFNHLILCLPRLLLPSIFPSIQVFSNEFALRTRWPKYWSFSIRSSSEYSVLISFRIDWFDVFALQGTLKSLHQHHSLKSSILWHSAFFMDQLSHEYMTTGKTIALTV